MNEHIYNPEFDNQYLTLPQLSKLTKIPQNWYTIYLCRSEFDKNRARKSSKGGGMLFLYNKDAVDRINQLRSRRYAKGI